METLSAFKIIKSGYFHSRHNIKLNKNELTADRTVNCFEVEIFLNDGGTSYINQTCYDIKRGSILVAKPGQLRHSRLHFSAAYLHIEVFDRYIQKCLENLPDFLKVTDENKYIEIVNALSDALHKETDQSQLFITYMFYKLLYALSSEAENNLAQIDSSEHLVLRTKKYIDENYQEPLTLASIAKTVNLSPVYFHRLFKSIAKQTPCQYLQEVRLSTAKKMLEITENSIEAIGLSCGFSSQAYFSDFFKRKTGMSPRQWRKIQRSKYRI